MIAFPFTATSCLSASSAFEHAGSSPALRAPISGGNTSSNARGPTDACNTSHARAACFLTGASLSKRPRRTAPRSAGWKEVMCSLLSAFCIISVNPMYTPSRRAESGEDRPASKVGMISGNKRSPNLRTVSPRVLAATCHTKRQRMFHSLLRFSLAISVENSMYFTGNIGGEFVATAFSPYGNIAIVTQIHTKYILYSCKLVRKGKQRDARKRRKQYASKPRACRPNRCSGCRATWRTGWAVSREVCAACSTQPSSRCALHSAARATPNPSAPCRSLKGLCCAGQRPTHARWRVAAIPMRTCHPRRDPAVVYIFRYPELI